MESSTISFNDLPISWKTLIIIGIISLFIMIGLIIFVILIFKTDLISLDFLVSSKTNIDEYNDFLEDFNNSIETTQDILVSHDSQNEIPDINVNNSMSNLMEEIFDNIDVNDLISKKYSKK